MGYKLFFFSAESRKNILVELCPPRVDLGQAVALYGIVGSRSHGLSQPHARKYRHRVAILPIGDLDYLAVYLPVVYNRRAVLAEYIPAGKLYKVARSDLDIHRQIAFEDERGSEAVVALLVGDVCELRIDGDELSALADAQSLIEQVDAPIEHHAAAVHLLIAPVAGDAARALNTGLDTEHPTQLVVVKNLSDTLVIRVPASVLVDGEKLAVFFGRGYHLLELFAAERHGLLGDNVLARRHGGYDYLLMYVVGRCNGDKVNSVVGKQLLARGEGVNTVGLGRGASLGLDIIDAYELRGVLEILDAGRCVPAAHSAVAYNGKAYFLTFIHCFVYSRYKNISYKGLSHPPHIAGVLGYKNVLEEVDGL